MAPMSSTSFRPVFTRTFYRACLNLTGFRYDYPARTQQCHINRADDRTDLSTRPSALPQRLFLTQP